LKKILISH